MSGVRLYLTLREGRSLDPEELRRDIESQYGKLEPIALLIGSCEFDNEVVSDKVDQLVRAMEGGAMLPPILAVRGSVTGSYKVLDGNHRVVAHQRLGRETVAALVPSEHIVREAEPAMTFMIRVGEGP